ncbi:C-type lectin domain family 10 member A [Myxocyprinus asiaticus]|uniref:C-type lectin domain family 10 member A n=1 Tax=Myxocyprinus asiaticus TaxID=70543 RepID=UPI00222146F7|nr:C-type lectin domain family 10 member A [Myxocyprinus asiaticus]
MAEFKRIQDFSSHSQNKIDLVCLVNEDMNRRPSQTWKGRLWSKQCCLLLMYGMLFMALVITVSVTFRQQSTKLSEAEIAVVNLTFSAALLSSNQQDTNERFMKIVRELKADLGRKLANLTQFSQQPSKLSKVENAVANLTSSVALLSSNQQETNDKFMEMVSELKTKLESRITNLTQQVEDAVVNLSSSVALISSNQQDTNDRFMEILSELKAELESRITNLTQILSCKTGWELFLSNCYTFSSSKQDWNKARTYCRSQGALLLNLGKDTREWDFIVKRTESKSYWFGLTDATTGQWRWVDGTPYIMDSSKWEPGEPNNWEGKEDCGELTATGKLNDAPCSMRFQFICKGPAIES